MKLKLVLFTLVFLSNLLHLFGQVDKNKENKIISVEVPEVQELLYIIFAISKEGVSDSILINHNSDYYREVKIYFDKYKNERIVTRIGGKVARDHYQIQMDATNYFFDENERLIRNNKYNNLSWGKKDYLKNYISELENFSKKTNFRIFYKKNHQYYDSLISLMQMQAPLDKQLFWLESRFSRKYNNIKVVFSPLNNGKHATNYKLNDLIIWVSKPLDKPSLSKPLIEAFSTRMLFTEIDHNYVNPISDLYLVKINKAFRKRDTWVAISKASWYKNQYSVFNEYMTWSVFILFAFDNYQDSDFVIIKNDIEDMMISYRGFHNFKAFNEKMLELYKNKTTTKLISDLYPDILEWSAKQ